MVRLPLCPPRHPTATPQYTRVYYVYGYQPGRHVDTTCSRLVAFGLDRRACRFLLVATAVPGRSLRRATPRFQKKQKYRFRSTEVFVRSKRENRTAPSTGGGRTTPRRTRLLAARDLCLVLDVERRAGRSEIDSKTESGSSVALFFFCNQRTDRFAPRREQRGPLSVDLPAKVLVSLVGDNSTCAGGRFEPLVTL